MPQEASDALRPELTAGNVQILYGRIKHCANECGLRHLPDDYRTLNEGPVHVPVLRQTWS